MKLLCDGGCKTVATMKVTKMNLKGTEKMYVECLSCGHLYEINDQKKGAKNITKKIEKNDRKIGKK